MPLGIGCGIALYASCSLAQQLQVLSGAPRRPGGMTYRSVRTRTLRHRFSKFLVPYLSSCRTYIDSHQVVNTKPVPAQGPWLAHLYALLCEAEADGTHGRSRGGCYQPLRFRSLAFIAPSWSHVAMWWNQRRGAGWFDTARSPAIGIPARLAPSKVD